MHENLNCSIINALPDAILVTDLKGSIIDFNNTFSQLWLIPNEIAITKDIALIFNYLDSKIQQNDFFVKEARKFSLNIEDALFEQLNLFDGRVIEFYTIPHWVDNMIVARIWNFRDITEHKRVERMLKQQRFELENAQKIALLTSWTFDLRSREFIYSESISQICGGLLAQQSLEQLLNVIHSDDKQNVEDFFDVSSYIFVWNRYEIKYRVIDSNGKEYHVRTLIEIEFDDEKPKLLKGISQDITQQAMLEKSLASAKEAADDYNQAKEIFLANMSHEMRTPLNAILGYAEILLQNPDEKYSEEYARAIKSSGESLLSLIEDMFYISNVEGQKINIIDDKVNITFLINEISKLFKYQFEEKNLIFQTEIDEKVPENIIIDKVRLKQILINLIGNALKFTSEGFVKIRVSTRNINYRDKVDLKISVEDTGIGIEKKFQEKIFDSFRQIHTDDGKSYEGAGLGLYIAKKNVELLGGTIEVQSLPDIGTMFIINLKNIKIAEFSEIEKAEQLQDISNISFEQASILVVDDRDFNRRIIKGLLSAFDFEYIEAINGIEAEKITMKLKPALILMDLNIPEKDGIQTMIDIKTKFSEIPVIAYSRIDQTINIQNLIKMGFDDFLAKPVSYKELLLILRKFIPFKVDEEDTNKLNIEYSDDIQLFIKDKNILDALKNELLISYEELLQRKTSKNQKDFALKLADFAVRYNLEFLAKIAGSFILAIDVFDIEKVEKNMRILKSIFEKKR